MSWVEIVSAVLGLTCVFLAGRNSKYNFWVGYLYCIFLFCLFWKQHLYAAMILQPVSLVINIFGHYRWTHPADEEKSAADETALKVSRTSIRQWACYAGIVVAAGTVWALVLHTWTEDASPWLDSYSLMVTLLAQYLSAQKRLDCWFVWLAVNVFNLALYISSGLYLMPVVSFLYLVNALWALKNWKNLYKDGK